jgi:Flp pilus assembly protein TadG
MKRGLKLKSKGQALVEMTLLLPIILVFVGGLTDVGLAFFVGTSMENAVREGARLRASGMSVANVQTAVVDRIAAKALFTPTFNTGNVTVTAVPAPIGGTSCTLQTSVTVTASGLYNYMFLRLVGISSTTMSRSETMRFEGPDLCN